MDIRALLYDVVYTFGKVLEFTLLLRVILSWLPINTPNILYQVTEPILAPIRKMIANSPLGGMMIDFSVLIAYFLIQIVTNLILGLI